MRLLLLPLLFLLCGFSSQKVELIQVVDGDTYDVTLTECVVPPIDVCISKSLRIRLAEVNTPEKFGEEKPLGLEVKRQVRDYLVSNPIARIEYMGKEKFGRDLARVYLEDGTDLGAWITERNFNKYKCHRWAGMEWSGRYDNLGDPCPS